MEAEFNADTFVQSFERTTMGIVQQSLEACDAVIATVADRFVKKVRQFQADMQEQVLADHLSIDATDIMRRRPTVQQVMAMPPFVQALKMKNEEHRALAQSIVAQRSVSISPSQNATQPEDLSAGEDARRHRQRS